MYHVWIAYQDSHEIRLYHSTNFICLLEISIRSTVTQKLQGYSMIKPLFLFNLKKSIFVVVVVVCDDIIRAHKLGCLHVTT